MKRKGLAALLIAACITLLGSRAGHQQPMFANDKTVRLSLAPTLPPPAAPSFTQLPETTPKVAGAELIHDLGQPLLKSDDATQRQTLTKAIRDAATSKPRQSSPNLREPQALDILSAAYFQETSSAVKIEIISALSEFSIPEAAELINRALEDGDPAVRQAAQQAKVRRDRRILFSRCCE